MACLALEHALPAGWMNAKFEAHRQQRYLRELLFSMVVKLTTLVSLGLRPILHTAARQIPALLVSLACLYDKVNHTESAVLRALVRGSAERIRPMMAAVAHGADSLPGWRLRVLDGNHLPASEKHLLPLPGCRGNPWWCMTRTLAWSQICWPARTRTRASCSSATAGGRTAR